MLSQINLNHINVFNEVYKTKNMTVAADNLHLTQSGVSQHIKALEDSLQVTLFDRVNQRIIPTAKAKELYEKSSLSLETLDKALWEVKGNHHELSGIVSIGMPIEFGNNLVIPLLSDFGRAHKKVNFQIYMDFANKLNDMLLDGEIDFAFVDDFKMDKRIETQIVYSEQLCLCIANDDSITIPDTLNKKFFEDLTYVDYQKDAPVLPMWFEHNFKSKINYHVKAYVMDVQGIARFITSGMAAGILPLHVVRRLEATGHNIHVFKIAPKNLQNHISVASVSNRSQSRSAEVCYKYLVDELKEKQKINLSSLP